MTTKRRHGRWADRLYELLDSSDVDRRFVFDDERYRKNAYYSFKRFVAQHELSLDVRMIDGDVIVTKTGERS